MTQTHMGYSTKASKRYRNNNRSEVLRDLGFRPHHSGRVTFSLLCLQFGSQLAKSAETKFVFEMELIWRTTNALCSLLGLFPSDIPQCS